MVHFNPDAGLDITAALKTGKYNALAVLGIMFEIGEENRKLQPFFEGITTPHMVKHHFENGFSTTSFIFLSQD